MLIQAYLLTAHNNEVLYQLYIETVVGLEGLPRYLEDLTNNIGVNYSYIKRLEEQGQLGVYSSNLGSIVALKLIININTTHLVIIINKEPKKH